ncbi:methyltransferase FkbM [Pseudomonas sp. Marseille-QA0332]
MFTTIAKWLGLFKKPTDHNQAAADVVVVEDTSESVNSHLVAYDENLLERSRTQWQLGDWQSLMHIQRETLQHHPDRAKLALLVASAHQHLDNMSAASQFTRLAQNWGCSKKLISQVLIAGVHNTLGRATAIGGRSQQALHHFQEGMKIVTPGADMRVLAQTRIREELSRLGISAPEVQSTPGSDAIHLPAGDSAVQQLAQELQKQHSSLNEQIKQQNAEMIKIRKSLENTVRSEMLNAAQQLEAFLGIQNFLNHGERLPGMHGWPISPDFALYLIELIDSKHYDLILEFGSGTSTVIIAKTLARIGQQRRTSPPVQVAFEHLEQYYNQTHANLIQADLIHAVQLVLAPLVPFQSPSGNMYSYYDCHSKLAELKAKLTADCLKILMIVDGPPGSTGKHARYPAVPAVLKHFKGAALDIVLDDYIRSDEKEVAEMWLKEVEAVYSNTSLRARKMEKDACLISATP